MKKLMALAGAVLMAGALCSCSKKVEKGEFTIQKGKLMVAMEVGYPPFEYYAEDGTTPMGFDVELGKELANRLDLDVEFIDTAWDGIFAGLNTNRYDVVISACTITPERLENFDFSVPYIGNGQAIILHKDSTLPITEMKDLENLKVGYQGETTSDIYTKKISAQEGWKYKENAYDKVMNAYDDLRLKRIDAVVSDNLVAVNYLGKEDSPFKRVFLGDPDEYFGVTMKKGNTVLKDKIDEALKEMISDGSMKELYIKVFGMDLSDSI